MTASITLAQTELAPGGRAAPDERSSRRELLSVAWFVGLSLALAAIAVAAGAMLAAAIAIALVALGGLRRSADRS